ncbi:hypothetical protein C8F01DRAFT_1233032 [Mycena amicta]|nr:hypothetical protein C8F01DRAFT_1233032 [Mycena amicta]
MMYVRTAKRDLPKTAMPPLFEFSVLRAGQSFITGVFRPVHDPCLSLSLPKLGIILRLPDKLLCEIFSHLQDLWFSIFNRRNPLWTLTQVCVRWRALVLAEPRFWCDINCRDWMADHIAQSDTPANYARAIHRTLVQLSRSAQAALTLELIPGPVPALTYDILAQLFAASAGARLESALLILDKHLLHRFLEHEAGFPALRSLHIALASNLGELDYAAIPTFLARLTALEELRVSDRWQLKHEWLPALIPVWQRLRVCELKQCAADDILLVMPHFSAGTRLRLVFGLQPLAKSLIRVVVPDCKISSLSLDQCDDIADILGNITAPVLQRLAIWTYHREPFGVLSAMLHRSSASLTHLALGLPSDSARDPAAAMIHVASLLAFLGSTAVEGLLDLDLQLFDPSWHNHSAANNHLVNALALIRSPPVLPNLRSLALRGYLTLPLDGGYLPLDGADQQLLALATNRHPVFKSLWLEAGSYSVYSNGTVQTLTLQDNVLSKGTLKKLHALGVELVRSHDFGWW